MDHEPPTMAALQAEEESLRLEQEREIAEKRDAAVHTAKERGFELDKATGEAKEPKPPEYDRSRSPHRLVAPEVTRTPVRSPNRDVEERLGLASPISTHTGYNADSETEPFPSYPTSPIREYDELERPP